ncbi:CAP domain-containing protein, partial [Cytidiella melzeri]
YLSGHNSVRAAVGAAPLSWSSALADSAHSYASQCRFQHSGGSLGPFGENLAAGTGNFPASAAVSLFASDKPDLAHPFTHFTQVVWKATTQVGCGVALCSGIFDKPATYHVCLYNPVGNVVGEEQYVNISGGTLSCHGANHGCFL